jgi:hypothetical protein
VGLSVPDGRGAEGSAMPEYLQAVIDKIKGDAEVACDFAAADAILQLTSGHTAGSHFPNGIGESSNTVPTFSENFWSGCGS